MKHSNISVGLDIGTTKIAFCLSSLKSKLPIYKLIWCLLSFSLARENEVKNKKPIRILTRCIKKHNIRSKEIINNFIYYLLKEKFEILNSNTILCFQFIIHNQNIHENYLLNYFGGELERVYNVL